ncbi:MAG: RDD family protein [Chthonomonadales bacterium]
MPRTLQVITPEQVEVTYELAGIGSRFLAALIDHTLQIVAIIAIVLLTQLVAATFLDRLFSGGAPLYAEAAAGLVVFAVTFGYFIAFELLWAGTTPGKRAMGLRVVRDRGFAVDPYASIIRNLVRIIDFMPPMYGIGLVSVFFSRDYKRLGDYAAGTVVIKERKEGRLKSFTMPPPSLEVQSYLARIPHVDFLTPAEYRVIRRFVYRRHELAPRIQEELAARLAAPLLPKLNLEAHPESPIDYAHLLEAIERRYAEDTKPPSLGGPSSIQKDAG